MGHMIVKLPLIIQNRMIGMVQLEQMLQCPRGLLRIIFNVVRLNGWNIHDRFLSPAREKAR